MDILTVYADSQSEFSDHAIVRVYWRNGLHTKKIVDVRLALTCRDRLAAAEAIAIRYLLSEANILNRNRTGINLKIVVSKGAIKKMARQTTQKIELYQYGYPILTRYSEAEILVSKDKSWFPIDNDLQVIPLIDGERLRGVEMIEIDTMGMVAITRHALERYGEHCGTLDMNTSWKNLHRRLKGPLQKIQSPTNVLLHKLKKYGESPEIWTHPDNPLHYVFCPKSDHKVLVTVFNRSSMTMGITKN